VTAARLGRVRATAFAKLTLSLRVLGRRDDGFHELEALAVSIGQPHDTLEAIAVPHPPGVELELLGEDEWVPTGSDNLALRAAEALLVRAGRAGHGVQLSLRKRIPARCGLGGGSADAAAALLAVRRLIDVDVDDTGVLELAARLGSDVPFCVRGGAAWMRGRGDDLEPVELPLGLPMLVALPPFRLATPDVYRAWDELGGPRATRVVPAPPWVDALLPELVNDLEPAAERIEPRLVQFRERLEAVAGAPALLAGSGSGYVVPVAEGRSVTDLADRVGYELHAPVIAAATVSRGVRVEP
jgi:4-diphosphocytidyl-2-C-methyl-D-erythritol kinase